MAGVLNPIFEQMCRTCMRSDRKNENHGILNERLEMHSIYDFVDNSQDEKIQINVLLNRIVPTLPKIEMLDLLPKNICTQCLNLLSAYNEFQKCCIICDIKLRNLVNNDNNLLLTLSDPLQNATEIFVKEEIEHEPNITLEEFISIPKPQEVNENSIATLKENIKFEPPLDAIDFDACENSEYLQFQHENINLLSDLEVVKEETVWRCESCSICFLQKSHLMLHYQQNSNKCQEKVKKKSERSKCEMCDVTFTERRNLQRHMLNKHNMDTRTRRPRKAQSQSLNEIEDQLTLKAQLYRKGSTEELKNSSADLSSHTQDDDAASTNISTEQYICAEKQQKVESNEEVNHSCNFNDTLITDKSMLESEITNFEVWKCRVCLTLFYHKKNLVRHMKNIHKEDLPKDTQAVSGVENFKRLSTIYKCDECDKIFDKMSSLSTHKHHHLNPGASKTCQYCNKTFKKLEKLRDHENRHRNEKPYLCSECGKTFINKDNLVQHRLRHSSEKRYQCPQCPKKFFAQSDLCGHIRQVHNTKKPFVCEVCGAAFKRKGTLKMHMLIHTGDKPFKCDFCDKRFPVKEHMERHRRTHTGEKPFKCQYCSRCFRSPSDLRKHMCTHLGENIYLCELCPAGFRLARELRVHFATHRHDDDETKARNKQAWLESQLKLKIKIGEISSKLNENTLLKL